MDEATPTSQPRRRTYVASSMNPVKGEKPPLAISSTSHSCRSVSWCSTVHDAAAAALSSTNRFTSVPPCGTDAPATVASTRVAEAAAACRRAPTRTAAGLKAVAVARQARARRTCCMVVVFWVVGRAVRRS